jgi:hypothetical protein
MKLTKANNFRWKHGNSSLPHKLPKHLVVYTVEETNRLMEAYHQEQLKKLKISETKAYEQGLKEGSQFGYESALDGK